MIGIESISKHEIKSSLHDERKMKLSTRLKHRFLKFQKRYLKLLQMSLNVFFLKRFIERSEHLFKAIARRLD